MFMSPDKQCIGPVGGMIGRYSDSDSIVCVGDTFDDIYCRTIYYFNLSAIWYPCLDMGEW